jgi:hypothetical protein
MIFEFDVLVASVVYVPYSSICSVCFPPNVLITNNIWKKKEKKKCV